MTIIATSVDKKRMRWLGVLTFLLTFIFCSGTVSAGKSFSFPQIKVIDNRDGLPSDHISAMCQDETGFIYAATPEGLCRYDGYNVKTFSDPRQSDSLLCDKDILCMSCAQGKLIYIGTNRGLFEFDTILETFTTPFKGALAEYVFNDIAISGSTLWAGTDRGLVSINLDSEEIFHHSHTSASSVNTEIRKIGTADDGNLWIAYIDGEAARFDRKSDSFTSYPTIKPGLLIDKFFADSGKIYAGTWQSGIYEICNSEDNTSATYRKSKIDGIGQGIIYDIVKDSNTGLYWIGMPKGVVITDDLIEPRYSKLLKLGTTLEKGRNEEIWTILNDTIDNSIWLGSLEQGIMQISLTPSFISGMTLSDAGALASSTIPAILELGNYLYCGVKSSGFVIMNLQSGRCTYYRKHPILKRISESINTANTISYIKSRNEIWIGSRYDGIWIIAIDKDGSPVEVRHLPETCSGNTSVWETSAIFEDNRDRIWIGGSNGIRLISNNGSGRLHSEEVDSRRFNIPYSSITGIAQSPDGKIWISTAENGIYASSSADSLVFSPVRIEVFGSWRERTTMLSIDSNGNIWAGSPGCGLLQYESKSERFISCSELEGTGTVFSLIEAGDGQIWMGTNRGIFCYSPVNGSLNRLTSADGLAENIFLHNAVCAGKDSLLYFGGNKGISVINLKEYPIRRTALRKPVITDISIAGNSIMREASPDGSKILRTDGERISGIITSSEKYSIDIEFSALAFSGINQIRYRCKLEGFDDWTVLKDGTHRIHYDKVPSGRYVFKLTSGSFPGDNWDGREIRLDVRIKPAIYKTWWAWTLYIFIALSILVAIIRSSISRIRLNNSLAKAKFEKEKTEEINNLKLSFFTNISHELLTPLAILSYGIEELDSAHPEIRKTTDILKRNTERLLRLLEQILEFRKAESGRLRLRVSRSNISELIGKIATENFLPLIDKKKLTLTLNSDPGQIFGWFDSDKIDKIVYNLLSNAYKYNIEGGRIDVTILGRKKADDNVYGAVEIIITNTGERMDADKLNSIFDRFQDGEYRKFKTKGFGIGLSLTKDLVELHKGTVSVYSDDSGTRFHIYLPLAKDAYSADEIEASSQETSVLSRFDVDENNSVNASDDFRTVLIVEDNTELRSILKDSLSGMFRIITAGDGSQGLSMARKENPDIIVSDVMMEPMNGYEMCRQLKEDIDISHIPVILLTALVSADDKIAGLDSGADAYLSKPVPLKLLKSQIKALLNSRRIMSEKFRMPEYSIPVGNITTLDDHFLKDAIKVVEKRLDDTDFGIPEFIEAMNVSNSMLYRKLKSLTGLSPNEFIRNVRLKAGYRILKEKGDSITVSEVAYMVGFSTPKYFTGCFKKEFGILPSELQNGGFE